MKITRSTCAYIVHQDLVTFLNIFLRSNSKGLKIHEIVILTPLAAFQALLALHLPLDINGEKIK